jgi:hypothetical protein
MAFQSEDLASVTGSSQRRPVEDLYDSVGTAHRQAVTVRAEGHTIRPASDDVQGKRFLPDP